MATDRRKGILLAGLLAVLAVIVVRGFVMPRTSPPGPAASNRSAARGARGPQVAPPTAPEVNLEALESERPAPESAERNVFRFKPKPAPPPPPVVAPPPSTATGSSGAPAPQAGPPPPPPITLKFIGIVEQPGTKAKIAVLSDGHGPPMFGQEGGTVAGRYRVLRIGVESIELSYLDGRGRQTIRLTGG